MSDLHSLIKKIQTEAVSTDSYVYYNKDNGAIHKISAVNISSTEFGVVVIPTKDVMPILTGKKRLEEYIIFSDTSSKKLVLKAVNDIKTYNTSSVMCYRLPVIKDSSTVDEESTDIIVRQDLINKEWKIKITPATKNFLISTTTPSNETLYFSVTSKFDPNILYRSLEVNASNLIYNAVSIPFKYDVEGNKDNISIYTAKYFDNYIHEIIQ